MKRLSLPQVEDRIRAAMQARSEDCAPVEAEEEADPEEWTPVRLVNPTPASRDRLPVRRLVAAAAAIAVVVGAGVAVRLAREPGETGERSHDVRSAAALPDADAPEPLPTCGTELPMTVTVRDAEGPLAGPAPGATPAEPGQVVQHWLRADDVVEVRWPARPRAVYDLDGGANERPVAAEMPDEAPDVVMPEDAPRAEFDLDDGVQGFVPELIVVGNSNVPQGCEVMEVNVTGDPSWGRVGLRLIGGETNAPESPHGDRDDLPYELVDLNALITERRSMGGVTHPVARNPNAVIPCDDPDLPSSRSGGADRSIHGESSAEVLQAFLATDAGRSAGSSGWIEEIQSNGTVTYGQYSDAVNAMGWTSLVDVVEDEDGTGWHLAGWRRSAC